MRYRILIEQDEDGVFVAQCPSLPGSISQGKTRKDALQNIHDAVKGYIASLDKHNEPVPLFPSRKKLLRLSFDQIARCFWKAALQNP